MGSPVAQVAAEESALFQSSRQVLVRRGEAACGKQDEWGGGQNRQDDTDASQYQAEDSDGDKYDMFHCWSLSFLFHHINKNYSYFAYHGCICHVNSILLHMQPKGVIQVWKVMNYADISHIT